MKPSSIPRRRFLQGVGTAVALPAFQSLLPAKTLAQIATKTAPLRTAYVYIPNGVNVEKWMPRGTGRDFTFGPSMQPIQDFKEDIQVITDLKHHHGASNGDGGGDHARANATFLTGARPRKTAGADIKLGISADQVAANHLGENTRIASLELSCAAVRNAGRCDSGYACAYQYNMSWRSDTAPMTPETDPRLVFERLFGSGNKEERTRNFEQRQERQRSILDFVMDDAKNLHQQMGRNDQMKLDQYLTSVREIERRIERSDQFPIPNPGVDAPVAHPKDKSEHIRLMYDMMVLAFQTDSTRIATFLQANDGDNNSFNEIGVPEGHHTLSHHQGKDEKLNKLAKIDHWYMEHFHYFLDRLSTTKDIDGQSLLHNSMIVFGSGLSDGQSHRHDKLPVILAGHAGGRLTPGRQFSPGKETPMSNLYLSMFDIMGVPAQERFGDSTGRLGGLV